MMNVRKRGSIVVVLALLGSLFVLAMGLVFHTSGERKSVKQMLGHRTAESAALSGIDWAESKLRKDRWYMTPFVQEFKHEIVKGLPTFGKFEKVLPNDAGKFTVVCQDVASKQPLRNIMGMQELWLLNHIDIYSLGKFKNKKCLFYARYIISPEPALNSNATDGLKYALKEMNPFGISVKLPETIDAGNKVVKFKIKKILAHKKEKVDINSIIAEVTPEEPKSSTVYQIRPSGIGKVSDLLVKEGDICNVGASIITIEKDPLGKVGIVPNINTLKKMVRLTKIDLKLFPNFDINSLEDRESVSSYIANTADAFLMNFSAHASLVKHLNGLNAKSIPDKLKYDELFKNFPTTVTNSTRNRAENSFIAYMIKNFVSPGSIWSKKDKAKKLSYLQLDHKKTNPPAKLLKKLEELNMKWVLNSKPRKDSAYYSPKFLNNQFLQLLSPDLDVNTQEFVQQLSGLDDASRMIDIKEGPFTTAEKKETKDSIDVTDPNAKPNPVKISVKKIRKKYTYVDPVNDFTIEIEDLVGFIKKYYSSESSFFPKESQRLISHIDWPLPSGPSAPPNVGPGMRAVWHPGIPGTPPNASKPEKWEKIGGTKREMPFPTGGERDFEKPGQFSSKKVKTYRMPATPLSSTNTSDSNPPIDVVPKSSNSGNGNPPIEFGDGDETKGKPGTTGEPGFSPSPKSKIFGTQHPPLSIDTGGSWKGTPGSPGIPPIEGKWTIETIPPPPKATANSNNSKPHCCFAAGTKILLEKNVEKSIEEVKIGDKVLAFDLKNKAIKVALVKEIETPIRNHITTLTFSNGTSLKLTNEHPVFTNKGWASLSPKSTYDGHKIRVKPLEVGALIKTCKNDWLKLVSIHTILKQTQVYNLSRIEPYNTYFAENILVHNKGGAGDDNSSDSGGENSGSAGVDGAQGNAGSSPTGSGGNKSTGGGPGGANGNGTNSGGNTNGGGSGSNPTGSGGNQIAGGGPGGASGNGTSSGGNTNGNAGGSGTNSGANTNNNGTGSANGSGSNSRGSSGSNGNSGTSSSSGNSRNSSSNSSGRSSNSGYSGSSSRGSSGYSSSGSSGGGGSSYSSYSGGV